MSVKKRLFLIFGPVITAVILLFAIFLSPFWLKDDHVSSRVDRSAATAISPMVLKGRLIKSSALAHGYVAFMGSSEWSRFDPFHPSVLAQKYHRSYRPFLMGARGTQSLTQFFNLQSINQQVKGKKVVFFVSPQWFVKPGEDPNAFSFYYSPLQTTSWLQRETGSRMDRYAATRLLDMPSGRSDKIIAAALTRIAAGKRPTAMQMVYIKYRNRLLLNEDEVFSQFQADTHDGTHNERLIAKDARQLPSVYNYQKLDQLAGKIGQSQTNNNPFHISNQFWNQKLKRHVKGLRGFQKHLSYLKSPEYSDFQLVLNQFAKDHTKVLFIIPPINSRWQNYTGLSEPMLQQFDRKITYQLRSQGFTHIDDLTNDSHVPYLMTDTIHPGWRGWLKMDRAIDPFLTKSVSQPHYHINPQFYSKHWQQDADPKIAARR
ncbi:D-alanyl-lipoteichoic acid biosynthesis protein DltD [Secundilactobacillus paracollinoides]|uniref:Protein DltD n=1 Tax=Secundilactobacillus paracollinoides TaxID=240427 RepID=A0A1B2IVC0_9LACO|nr:D-alanyl-lipoteichoic acid biosynthesis protein DltD [Secundilactobacillus paracollinoides]ANZ60198.1 D-alanyl-lipoteichoic acid biosynthesis protein DltD [Secundilactobacillus paracollinoides]ANZ62852.1 D-alanyl-lipoteichoic acid biosynthesis protein DltD [Secundilactobacillus paracollinoides]ANZ65992.1 D-alanyl-lipoteichoic acid biosynthesis protein DltD [Secundilactobacillus paracollinoides]